MNDNEEDKEYSCPRCGGNDIIDYGNCFDCADCQLEFSKEDVDEFDDDEVLSTQEKKEFGRMFWSSWF